MFGPDKPVSRLEMAALVVKSLSDEQGVTDYLNATGGCPNSFSDITPPDCDANQVTNTTGGLSYDAGRTFAGGWRYAEYAYRRGLTKGCGGTVDVSRKFCPNDPLQRYEAATFIIRAKMSNVFPTVVNGCPGDIPLCGAGRDNFGLFVPINPFFDDIPVTDPNFSYIQKMYELRITNGVIVPVYSPDSHTFTGGTFGPNDQATRREVAAFVARAFFD